MKHITNIEKNLIQRFAMMLLLGIISITYIHAEEQKGQYDIYFRDYHEDDGGTSSTERTEIKHIIASTTYSYGYVDSISDPVYIYNSGNNTDDKKLSLGIRLGSSKGKGSVTIHLAKECQIRSAKLGLGLSKYYNSDKKSENGPLKVTVTYTDGTTETKELTVINSQADGNTININTGTAIINHRTMVLSAEKYIQKIKLESHDPDYPKGRIYCKYIMIFSAPVILAPSVTTTQTTANITTPGITYLGSEHFSVIEYGFVFSPTNSHPTIGANNVTKYKVGTKYDTNNPSFSKSVEGLTPGTPYYVRPYAITTQLDKANDTCTTYSEKTTLFYTQGYVAKFDAGTHGTCANPTIEEVSNTAGITLPSVTPKTGYRFLGWSTSNSATPLDTLQAGSNYNLEEDMTFYAVYIQQFTVQWLIDGQPTNENSPTTIVDKDSKVTQLPTSPNQEEDCGLVFMGWTDAPIINMQDGPPTPLFTTIEESPQIKENTTFYAVFADVKE